MKGDLGVQVLLKELEKSCQGSERKSQVMHQDVQIDPCLALLDWLTDRSVR